MGAHVNGKKLINIDELHTTGKTYLGSDTPLFSNGFQDQDTWIASHVQIGEGIISQASGWGTSLLTIPSTGFGTTHIGTCSFDLAGGTHESLFTKVSAIGAAFDFTAADVGKVIILASGAHPGGIALIEQYISATEVILTTCGWDADVASGTLFVLCDDPISFTSPQIKINNVGAACEWTNRSYAHTGVACTKLYAEAAADGVNNLSIVTLCSGYANVDSMIIEHETGGIVSGSIQNVVRISIGDGDANAGAEIAGIKLTRGGTSPINKTDGIRIGTSFNHALHVDGSVATDPFYAATFVSGHTPITKRSNLGAGIALSTGIRMRLVSHVGDGAEHYHGGGATPDTVNLQFPAGLPPVATDLATLITLTAYMLTGYAAHHTDALAAGGGSYHNAQFSGATGTLADASAPTTMDECISRLNDLKAKYNVHDSTAPVHTAGGVYPVGTASIAGDGSFINPANNVQIFPLLSNGILIGSADPFSIISYTHQVVASVSITPTFEYSTGDGTWATLPVSDTTVGFTLTGKISFAPPTNWAVTASAGSVGVGVITSAYYVRITRTRGTLGTPPTENSFKIYTGASDTDMIIHGNGSITPGWLADASAANDTIYYSTIASKLVYKDSAGTVHNLY
jgi:hypothetical protein